MFSRRWGPLEADTGFVEDSSMHSTGRFAVAAALCVAAAACGASPHAEAPRPSVAAQPAPTIASPAASSEVTWHSLADPDRWQFVDPATLGSTMQWARGGVAANGYLYVFGFNGGSGVARFRSAAADLADPAAWSFFDPSSLDLRAGSIGGSVGAFDGRYVYLAPCESGVAARLDTSGAFDSASSWTLRDVTALHPAIAGSCGTTFDGRYVYFRPHPPGDPPQPGPIARYDTTSLAGFANGAAWESFDPGALVSGPFAMASGFDGSAMYFHFYADFVARFETTPVSSFDAAERWTAVDVRTFEPRARAFADITAVGERVYFLPSTEGIVAQYRAASTASLGDRAAWTFFELSELDVPLAVFGGGTADGRYVYLAPGPSGRVVRFDARSASGFEVEMFDLTTLHAMRSAQTAVFDGRYVYFLPRLRGPIARFDAREPAEAR
jgi:hypothetical protein